MPKEGDREREREKHIHEPSGLVTKLKHVEAYAAIFPSLLKVIN